MPSILVAWSLLPRYTAVSVAIMGTLNAAKRPRDAAVDINDTDDTPSMSTRMNARNAP